MNQFSLTATSTPFATLTGFHPPHTLDLHRPTFIRSQGVGSRQGATTTKVAGIHEAPKIPSRSCEISCLFGWSCFLVGGWLAGLDYCTVRWFDFYIVSGRWDEVSSVGSMIKCGWGRQMDDGMSFCWWSLMGSKWCLRKSYLLFVGHMCAALLPSSKHECSMLGGMLHWPYRIYYWKQESSGPSTGHVDHKLNYIQLYSVVYRIIHRSCPQIVQTFMVEWQEIMVQHCFWCRYSEFM